MQLATRHFGTINIEEEKIISFSDGLPGFEDVKKFVIINPEGESSQFCWLQGVDQPQWAFVIVNPFNIKKDYDVELSDEITKALDITQIEDVAIYSIVVVPEEVSKISMNLKAPVVVNTRNNRGIQVILDTDKYSVRHYIMEELQKQGG